MNILVTTLGTSWAVVPELLGFLNPVSVPLLSLHAQAAKVEAMRRGWAVEPVDEVWIATTRGSQVAPGLASLGRWQALAGAPAIRTFTMAGVAELATVEECLHMRELIFRLVLHAGAAMAGGKLYLSLAGGRKTMSADMQLAAETFGCDLLLHIVDQGGIPKPLQKPTPELFLEPLPSELASCISPIVIKGPTERRPIFQLPEAALQPASYPLPADGPELPSSTSLIDRVRQLEAQAANLMLNFTTLLVQSTALANFHALYNLAPATIQRLQQERIGTPEANRRRELEWLRTLPKAELHCHLGGILDAAGHLRVAEVLRAGVHQLAQHDARFSAWVDRCKVALKIEPEDLGAVLAPAGWPQARDQFGREHRHLATAAFLLHALSNHERVDRYLFRELLDPQRFQSIGIQRYEQLGDLQGSSLLQTRAALEAACDALMEQCRLDNVAYCELRCSPLNCIHDGLQASEVVQILCDRLSTSSHTRFKLIFIASRHGRKSNIMGTIELVESLSPQLLQHSFAGFDLAGAEHAMAPAEVEAFFRPALQDCHNITIHAGEDQPASNIWEAVYRLSAERIGHGLTLGDHPQLLAKFISRRIAVELCPSSNHQIVGFRDFSCQDSQVTRHYPLRDFLDKGLRVTVNTDDPGMSRTSLTQEFLRAAQMTEGGLSRWEILQLVRNGFKAAFVTPAERKRLMLAAEGALYRDNLILNP